MAKVTITRNYWYYYCPYPGELAHSDGAILDVTDEEERWLLENKREWEEVQKFLAAKVSKMEAGQYGK